jgi:hypothetical protein
MLVAILVLQIVTLLLYAASVVTGALVAQRSAREQEKKLTELEAHAQVARAIEAQLRVMKGD